MTILGALMGFLLLSGAAASVAAPTLPTYTVTVTAYNAVPEQTDSDPWETASGAYSNPEIIAARSKDLAASLPFGTIVELDGTNAASDNSCGYAAVAKRIGYRVIADAMNARYTNRIDILFDTKANYITADKGMKNAAEVLGICRGITMRVVGHTDINHLPTTQAALAKLVTGKGGDLAVK